MATWAIGVKGSDPVTGGGSARAPVDGVSSDTTPFSGNGASQAFGNGTGNG
ncbi:hypothetical protein [Streptomyces sp. NPDC047869]|uniref:hypothetical protein n=1 Tax=Streptomyces sp. NPDC047869 TaxID=3154709 RepID=UPI003452DF8C